MNRAEILDAGALPLAPAAPAADLQRVPVWDLPLRLFHGGLALAVGAAVTTGLIGGEWMVWHGRAGLAVLGLLAFRLSWGLVGGTHARFASFWPTPARLRAQWQGRWKGLGHAPLSALAVFALLGLLAAQVGTGLVGDDEIGFTGPLNHWVDAAVGVRLTGWHQELALVLYVLVALHVAAVLLHLLKGHDLLRPMWRGWKAVPAQDLPPAKALPARWPALVLALIVGAAAPAAVLVLADAPPAPTTTTAPRW